MVVSLFGLTVVSFGLFRGRMFGLVAPYFFRFSTRWCVGVVLVGCVVGVFAPVLLLVGLFRSVMGRVTMGLTGSFLFLNFFGSHILNCCS